VAITVQLNFLAIPSRSQRAKLTLPLSGATFCFTLRNWYSPVNEVFTFWSTRINGLFGDPGQGDERVPMVLIQGELRSKKDALK
jgi:hypothetical protein